jgi:hypothetical protein
MVNHKVRHLEQSFVTLKIRVRVEMTFHTPFARAPNAPSANGRIIEPPPKRQTPFCYLVPFPEKVAVEAFQSGRLWNSGFQNKADVAARNPQSKFERRAAWLGFCIRVS